MDFRNIRTTFTSDQQRAIKTLSDWYKSTDLICTLEGAAGTGKTFILDYFVNQIVKHSVCVTAPTHKAVRVVEKRINRRAKTLHSLHGLRLNVNLENFNIDKIKFDTIGETSFGNYKIIIIDESSMINTGLFTLNQQRAIQFNTKILYVGDKYQLPPVGEQVAKCFTINNKAILNEIVRQDKDNPLINILTILRGDIDKGTANFIRYIRENKHQINNKGEGYETLDAKTFAKKVKDIFSSKEFENNIEYVRYTAWTNKSITDWNKYIRDSILENSSGIVSLDDLFTGYKTIVDDYLKPIIINSEDYIVEDIEDRISDYGFKVYRVVLRNVYMGSISSVEIADHKHESFLKYYNLLNKLHYEAINSSANDRGRKWREYYKFKERYLTLVNFDLKDEDESRGTVTKDLDYGFGLTVHKCQGSTYENVFVNVQDIAYFYDNKNKKYNFISHNKEATTLRNKLLYVATSRASKKCYFLLNN